MKKFISLVLALVMALSLTTIAWGAPTTVDVTSNAQLATVLKDTTAQEVVINLSETPSDGTHYIIDLYSNPTVNASIKSLTINGTGTTKVSFDKQQVNASLFSQLTINKCEILHMNTKSWGHLVFGSGVAGGVYTVSNCVFNGTDTQGIYINPDAGNEKYVIEGCTFTGGFGSEGAVTLQNNSEPTDLTVTNNDFDVAAGSEELTVHYHKEALTLNADVDETVLIKAGPDAGTSAEENFAKAVATADAGDTFKLMANVDVTGAEIDKPITINENGNTLTGLTAGAGVTTDASGKVTSGTFASAPANVADGYEALLTNGAYMVVPKTAADGTITTLKDADKYDIYPVAGTTSVKAANANITKKVVGNAIAADGTVTYTATTYSDGANVYVEVDSAVADYKLVQGNMVVAYMVNLADVGYVPTTTKTVTSYVAAVEKAACGQYSKATYPAGVYMIDGKAYAAGGANWALYNGKFVNYGGVATAVPHTYAVNTYNTTDKSVATLKCSVCKQVFTVLTPAQVKTMAPSAFTVATVGNTDYFIAVATAPVVTPSTDKVTSAETFDAGIAMYVGMSVMAAAGSAVVLKKKD